MTDMRDRERGYEAKFASDEELEFKAQARRDRKLALWAGERMKLEGEALESYITEVWRADLKHPGDQDVFDKVLADLTARQAGVDGAQLRAKMDALLSEARDDLHAGR